MRSLDGAQGRFLDSGRKWSWEVRGLVFLRRMRAGILGFRESKGLGDGFLCFIRKWGWGSVSQ